MMATKVWAFASLFVSILFLGCSSLIDQEGDDSEGAYQADALLNKASDYLVVFGDIQNYTANKQAVRLYRESIEWIINQIQGGISICSVLEVGDVTWNNSPSQWQFFRDNTLPLNDFVPYYACTGNHDYDWDDKSIIHDRKSTLINSYAHFPLTDHGIVAYYEDNSLENYVAKLFLPNTNLNILVLEFGAGKEVLEWANEYVQSHQEETFLLMTHEWLSEEGDRLSLKGCYAANQLKGVESFSTPEEVWKQLVECNDNILCVLCGHYGFFAKLFTENKYGRAVPQVLFNLQFQEKGGNGLVQLWEFPRDKRTVNIAVYSTVDHNWYLPESTSFSFPLSN